MEKEYLKVGTIKDSFGLDGTLKIYSTTSMPEKRYKPGSTVFLVNPLTNEYSEQKVISFRHSGLLDFVKVESINSPEEAKEYKGYEIHVLKDQKDLEKGMYFYSDLKCCDIFDEQENLLGKVKEVEEFPAQLTLRVSRNKKPDFFVPFVKEFIKSVDIENKRITIKIIEGLLWKL